MRFRVGGGIIMGTPSISSHFSSFGRASRKAWNCGMVSCGARLRKSPGISSVFAVVPELAARSLPDVDAAQKPMPTR